MNPLAKMLVYHRSNGQSKTPCNTNKIVSKTQTEIWLVVAQCAATAKWIDTPAIYRNPNFVFIYSSGSVISSVDARLTIQCPIPIVIICVIINSKIWSCGR